MDRNQDLLNRREDAKLGGGIERINKQHQQGKGRKRQEAKENKDRI
jgi:hypothetical protein